MVHIKNVFGRITVIDKIPTRFNVAIMLFFACFLSYMLRVNLSINILAMTYPRDGNTTNTSVPDYGPRYDWTPDQSNWLIGAYFWGYLVLSLPAGMLAEWFGGTAMIGWTLLVSGVITALSPMAAAAGFWPIFAVRFATGVLGGVLYPACHNLISKWAPPDEKGKFVSALLGNVFGTVITFPMCGLLIEKVGWVWAFYVPAIITIVMALVWFYVVSDSPATHKRISREEVEYIEKSLGNSVSKGRSFPPVFQLFTSLPFWALLLLHYGNLWGLYFLITAAPKFISEVLGFNIGKAGILSSLPYLARFSAGFVFGSIGDFIRGKGLISNTMIRKSFCLFSHVFPGLLLLSLIFVGDNPYVYIGLITLSLGFNGASTMTNLQNSQDLAPNFAGTIYGVINFTGTSTGFITPLVVGAFTSESNTIEDWHNIFIVGAVAYIVPAIIFAFFGSGDVQKWNEMKSDKKDSVQAESADDPTENGHKK